MEERYWIGEGVPKQVKNGRHAGKWRLQWKTIEPGTTAPKTVDRLFETRAAGIKWRDGEKKRLQSGGAPQGKGAKGLTLDEWFDILAGDPEREFADGAWRLDGVPAQTVGVKHSRWTNWVRGTDLALTPIRLLDRDRARRFVQALRDAGATKATKADVVGVVRKVVNDAIKERPEFAALKNPFAALPLENEEERQTSVALTMLSPHPETLLLRPKEVSAAMARLDSPRERALLGIALLAGLRMSEILAFQAEQIDAGRGVLLIDRAVKFRPNGGQYIGLPKGDKPRIVCLCPTLSALLVAAVVPGRGYLFGAETKDEAKMKTRFYEEWRETLTRAGLPEAVTPKVCRATHNNWIEKLMPTVSLSTRLGHMGHSLNGSRDGTPKGLKVNLTNYTAFIPEGFAPLRKGLEAIAVPRSARRLVRRERGVSRVKRAA